MRPVLIVTKDQSEFNQYQPVLRELASHGIPVCIVAEAISLDKWTAAGHEVIGGKPKEGFFDHNTGMRRDLDPAKIIAKLNPRVVMIGLAQPINLGEKFAVAVAEHNRQAKGDLEKIVTGFVEDLWGVHGRASVAPDFICTLDELGVGRIRAKPKYAATHVFATGNPAMDSLLVLKADRRVSLIAADYQYVVLAAGQDYSTTPMLEGLVAALDRVGNYLLFIRLHPKWSRVTSKTVESEEDPRKHAQAEKQLAAGNYWRHLVFSAKKGDVMLVRSDVSTQQIMLSSHAVVSIFSNTLLESAILGRIPVSWTSDIGREMMAQELDGTTRYPLCNYGSAIEVETPEDYLSRVPEFNSADHQKMTAITRERFKSGKSAEAVANIICSYF